MTAPSVTDRATATRALQRSVDQVAATLDHRPRTALASIDEDYRALALRYYLKTSSKARLDQQWAWSDEQIKAFDASAAKPTMLAAIDRVRVAFEEIPANAGHSLLIDERKLVRSLGRQIALWNGNRTVHELSARLNDALIADLDAWAGDAAAFRQLLVSTPLGKSPSNAVPGMSDHGRANAFDFKVVRLADRSIVVGASSAQIPQWDGDGWTARLRQAVTAAGNQFEGPLGSHGKSLYEPWHYEYRATDATELVPNWMRQLIGVLV